MKKILAFATGILLTVGLAAGMTAGCKVNAPDETKPAQEKLYFVPGTYVSDGQKIENTIASGATKLSDEDCAKLFTENVYRCALAAGEDLPVPVSSRTDAEGNAYSFNGWWAIVNATVTYFDSVPTVTETTFLYADWRADLSQRKDPVTPDGYVEVEPNHYMEITRKETGEKEKITLRSTPSDQVTETLGYPYSAELYAQGFDLNPGDTFIVYTTGLTNDEDAVKSPVEDKDRRRYINLETSGDGANRTGDYLSAPDLTNFRTTATLTYIAEESGTFNIYIKYFAGGSIMAVYMEPMA